MLNDIFKNYGAFYNMVISTTIMSNAQTAEFEADARKIIAFIGRAYSLQEEFIEECASVIFGKLATIARISDQQAVYGHRRCTDQYSDIDSIMDIKGDALAVIQGLCDYSDSRINKGWFDYKHYKTYQADIRYSKILITAASGNILTTRQAGILSALGIGCKVDYERAVKRLTQCAYWGDIPSIHFLSYAYALAGDDKSASLYTEVAELAEEYLLAGYTVLPEKVHETYSDEACTLYVYISSITQDIVSALNKNNIDFSFVEAITSATLDFSRRMDYINNYSKMDWKEITNASNYNYNKIGFLN